MQSFLPIRNKMGTVQSILRKSVFLISVLLVSLSVFRCNTDDRLEFDDIPVVESYLSVNKPVSIQVARKTPYDDNVKLSADVIDDLKVTISYGSISRIIPSQGGGVFSDAGFYPEEGVTYTLEFTYNNKIVSSSTQIPAKPANYTQSVSQVTVPSFTFGQGKPGGRPNMPDPVRLTWDNNDESYYMIVTENLESNPLAIFETNDTIDAPRRIFRNEPTQASQSEITGMSFQYYGRHRLILFHLNADYAALYQNTGNTSQNLTNPVTNVQNGLGIFTGINSDTLYLNVLKE